MLMSGGYRSTKVEVRDSVSEQDEVTQKED